MFTYNRWHYGIPGERDASVGGKLEVLGRVTDADFEVIEPKTEQHGNEASAGDGTRDRTTERDGNWNPDVAPYFADITGGIAGNPCGKG